MPYTKDQYIPAEVWGKDHWSTLAYVDSIMTDYAMFEMGLDPRMRSNRRNYRVMSAYTPKHIKNSNRAAAVVSTSPTRLNNGETVDGHDDWNCIEDMVALGFFTVGPNGLDAGVQLHLSPVGQKVATALRQHKQAGGQYAEFLISQVEDLKQEDLKPPHEEYFDFLDTSYNVALLIKAIEEGKVRPQKEVFDKDFIASFGQQILGLDKANPDKNSISMVGGIRSSELKDFPVEALKKPVILAYHGRNKGMLNIDSTGAHYLLIDGYHRMGKAYFEDTESMDVYIVSQSQIKPFKR